jgi:hypothetical protein
MRAHGLIPLVLTERSAVVLALLHTLKDRITILGLVIASCEADGTNRAQQH